MCWCPRRGCGVFCACCTVLNNIDLLFHLLKTPLREFPELAPTQTGTNPDWHQPELAPTRTLRHLYNLFFQAGSGHAVPGPLGGCRESELLARASCSRVARGAGVWDSR